MLVDEKLKDVVLFNPYLDEVITIDKKGRDNSILALIACARHLSKHKFDVLINLHPNERCSFIDALTSVKLRTGTTHTIFKWRWDMFTPLDRTMHAADMYLDVLKQLGVNDLTNNGLEIFPGERHVKEAADFWQAHGVTDKDKLIGFNIGSAVVTKRWAPERFAEVADHFANNGYKVVYFGGAWMKTWCRKRKPYENCAVIAIMVQFGHLVGWQQPCAGAALLLLTTAGLCMLPSARRFPL